MKRNEKKFTCRSDLQDARLLFAAGLTRQKKKVLVCAETGCVAGGSLEIFDRLKSLCHERGINCAVELGRELEKAGNPVDAAEKESIGIKKSGCHGFCEMGPLIRIEPAGWLFLKVKPEDCEEILETSIIGDQPVKRLLFQQEGVTYPTRKEIPFYKKQTSLVRARCGESDAESIEEYIAGGGYRALEQALFELSPEDICQEICEAGLRGRGGGGFPTGRKWDQVRLQKEPVRYVVCNGDEGDPGAFMDRSIMEGDPQRLLEGMIIAGIATGAQNGFIYVRAEYPLAIKRLSNALGQAERYGLLGERILGTDFSFTIQINQGAGAFVCGEGSALTASIEGNRGMPRVKPPRTVEQGLFGKPTVLNNVETFANVSVIVNMSAAEYRKIGTADSPGTKIFSLTGNVRHTGLIEVPMGTTLKEIVFDIGGGIKNDKAFKAVQIGGPSGGCLTAEHLDLPLDFESLRKVGAIIGSGGLVVMDEGTCMVDVARFFMKFTQNESCGKCVPCREGTKAMLNILERIVEGKGEPWDIGLLLELEDTISATSLCGLGKTAGSPVVSTIKYFRDEYIAHVQEKKCPAKTCEALKTIYIDASLCRGCARCSYVCPVEAISGEVKKAFVIDDIKCIKCKACLSTCKFGAIMEG
jgi:NADH-quinone oxidoreductase subunit F